MNYIIIKVKSDQRWWTAVCSFQQGTNYLQTVIWMQITVTTLKWCSNGNHLTFKWPTFAYVNTHKKTPEINFIYLGNKELYCIFKTCCIICFISSKCCLFHNLIFFCANNTFFINHVLKFKYQPGHLKVIKNDMVISKILLVPISCGKQWLYFSTKYYDPVTVQHYYCFMDNSLHSLHEVIQICRYLYSVVVVGGGGGGRKSHFFSKKVSGSCSKPYTVFKILIKLHINILYFP